ncbi:MAG: 5'-3' exonuclease H3TH domain-containing protein [Candidatus Paceibacterota bacterium]|jgi:DNA polymerase-1|nr:5'-3' exonuclease H3TH domain-containing protein [Candidatus Paceibacterota bacterium]
MEDKRLLIIDSNSVIHRAYHALPPLTTEKGETVGAVYGFLLVFLRALREFKPDFAVACFDVKGPTFRHEKYEDYKAKRPPLPEDLGRQIARVKELLPVFGVPVFGKEGFEADDLIGTIAEAAPKENPSLEVIILSGDTDTMQLVNEKTKVYNLRKGVKDIVLYDEEMVKEKYQGLEPSQLLDLRALKGDASDNIPGVPGIGEKTALSLLMEYKTLENIYDNIALIKGKIREKLVENKEGAFFSRELAEIKKDVPLDFSLENCRWEGYDKTAAAKILKEMEFYSLIDRLP